MAKYWANRVAELENMRPITLAEATAEAERCEKVAEKLEEGVESAESIDRETGRVTAPDTVQERDRRNAVRLGYARQSVWGDTTRALNLSDRAKAMRKIAEEPEGTALAESLAEARQRAEYYANLAAE